MATSALAPAHTLWAHDAGGGGHIVISEKRIHHTPGVVRFHGGRDAISGVSWCSELRLRGTVGEFRLVEVCAATLPIPDSKVLLCVFAR